MYCLFNNQLPLVFRTYCVRPAHPHGTRYAETNYFRPHHASKLSEKSIKIMGPKVWADVPLEIKSMPFRKSFTKNMKQHHIDKLPSVQRARVINFNRNHRDEFRDLQILFESDDENDSDFLGFDLDFERLEILFNSDTDDENDSDFPGFDLDFERLQNLFNSETDDENDSEFLGFELDAERSEIIFDSSTDDENMGEFIDFDPEFEALFNSSVESNDEFFGF